MELWTAIDIVTESHLQLTKAKLVQIVSAVQPVCLVSAVLSGSLGLLSTHLNQFSPTQRSPALSENSWGKQHSQGVRRWEKGEGESERVREREKAREGLRNACGVGGRRVKAGKPHGWKENCEFCWKERILTRQGVRKNVENKRRSSQTIS